MFECLLELLDSAFQKLHALQRMSATEVEDMQTLLASEQNETPRASKMRQSKK